MEKTFRTKYCGFVLGYNVPTVEGVNSLESKF